MVNGDNLQGDHYIPVISTIDRRDLSTLVLVSSSPTATRGTVLGEMLSGKLQKILSSQGVRTLNNL